MKDLFDLTLADEVKQRIMRLHPGSQPLWGSMAVAPTLAHCTSGIQMATGVIKPRRVSFPANFIGLVIKPLVFGNDKPMRRNSPSAPELFQVDPTQCDFERERSQLIAAIDSFVSKNAAGCSQHPHPFFGPLKPHQWAILMYKHVDHHLHQFGV
jgi:Protein of unknown function (DUF1569)